MLTFVDEEAHLRSANDHLRNAVYLIAVQQDRVQRAAGLNTVVSDALLSLMKRHFVTSSSIAKLFAKPLRQPVSNISVCNSLKLPVESDSLRSPTVNADWCSSTTDVLYHGLPR